MNERQIVVLREQARRRRERDCQGEFTPKKRSLSDGLCSLAQSEASSVGWHLSKKKLLLGKKNSLKVLDAKVRRANW